MKKILLDFDNTMGIEGKDVDDGLALLYLLGREDLKLEGVTTVFGNGELDQVKKATRKLFSDLELDELPLKMGASGPDAVSTPASDLLLEKVNSHPDEITILTLGPLTNLKNAYQGDSEFFDKVDELILMGGITEPIKVGEREVGELNFSCDPEAAKTTLNAPVPITVAESNLCLQAYFNKADWKKLNENSTFIFKYISDRIKDWYLAEKSGQNDDGTGFHLWDLVSSVYLTHPDLYSQNYFDLESSLSDLETGKLELKKVSGKDLSSRSPGLINVPREIKDITKMKELIFDAWENLADHH